MKQFDREAYLDRHIPYRLRSIAWFVHLAEGTRGWTEPKRIEISIDGKKCIVGSHFALTNPAIEVGILHARLLLEFLGMYADPKSGKIETIAKRKKQDDVGVEDFQGPEGFLRKVTIADVAQCYAGPAEEAERSLLSIYRLANKGVAHLTADIAPEGTTLDLLVHAAKGVSALTDRYFYRALGRPFPNVGIEIQRTK